MKKKIEAPKNCPVCNTELRKWEIDKLAHPDQDRPSYYCPKCDIEMLFWDNGHYDVVS